MVSAQDKIIFVTGATGQQGGAATKHLLASGWQIRALSRNPDKPAAKTLKEQGVEFVQGDLNDRNTLQQALKGVYGVFSVQTFAEEGTEGEERQGKILAEAVREAGIQHLVYSSVGGAERNSGVPHFESKWHVEQHLQALDVTRTVIRPAFFMENFQMFMRPAWQDDGTFTLAVGLKSETKLQMIATDDIGVFVAMAFNRPEEFIGKEIEIAGDELTMPEVVQVFERVLGKSGRFVEVSREQVQKASEEMFLMLAWFDRSGYQADISALRALYPRLTPFETWVRSHKWS